MKSLRAHEAVNCGVGAFFTLHAAFHAAIDYCAFFGKIFRVFLKIDAISWFLLRGGGGGRVCALQTAASIGCSRRTNRMRSFFGGCTPPAHDPSPTHLNISERSNPPAAAPIHLNISAGRRTKSKAKPQPAAREFEKLFFFFFFNERCCPLFLHPHYADFFVPNNLTIFRDNFTEKFGIFFLILKNWINFILSENWQRRTWICLFYGNFKNELYFYEFLNVLKLVWNFFEKLNSSDFLKKLATLHLYFWINELIKN